MIPSNAPAGPEMVGSNDGRGEMVRADGFRGLLLTSHWLRQNWHQDVVSLGLQGWELSPAPPSPQPSPSPLNPAPMFSLQLSPVPNPRRRPWRGYDCGAQR